MKKNRRPIVRACLTFLLILPLILIEVKASNAAYLGCTPKKNLLLYLDARDSNSYNGSGSTWLDLSGCNRNATLVNSPTSVTGSNGYLQFVSANRQYGYTSSTDSLTSFTIEAYYQITNTTNAICTAIITDSLPTAGGNTPTNFTIGTEANVCNTGKIYGAAWSGGTWIYSTGYNQDTNWHHVAMTATYTATDTGNLQLYLDSATVGSTVSATLKTGGQQINIARRWDDYSLDPTSDYLDAKVSYVKIINKTLTSTELQNEYLCTTSAPKPYVTIANSPTTIRKLGSNQTLQATSNCPGSTTFYYNNRTINRCSNIANIQSGNNFVATCTWKPIVQGPNAIKADMNVNYYPNNVSSTSYITVSPRNSSR